MNPGERFGRKVATEVTADGQVRQSQMVPGPFHVGEVVSTSPLRVDCPCSELLEPAFVLSGVVPSVGMRVLVIEISAELVVTGEVLDA